MFWARSTIDGSSVWPSWFNDDAGVPDMRAARLACQQGELVCPDYGGEVTATSASTRTRAHFKHVAGAAADADCPGTARMSVKHLAAQDNIARELQRRHPDAALRLEAVHDAARSGRAGRSDILLTPRTGAPLCVEVQASTIPVADLQERTERRAAEGYVIEWIFIVDGQSWTDPLEPSAMLDAVLKRRGYVYLLEDPMAEQPRLWVAVAPWISSEIPDLRNRYLPKGHMHFLRVARRVRDLTLVGTTPGGAGLRCDGLHHYLERWMNDSLSSLDHKQPRAIARQAPAVEAWRAEHERLEHELARTEAERAAARSALQQAIADATATAAAAAQPPSPPPEREERRRDRLMRWLRRQPTPDAFWTMPPARDNSTERLAASARTRVGTLRNELALRDVDHQAADETLAQHAARRTAAEQLDDARHGEALEAALAELEGRLQQPRTRIQSWLLTLPVPTREPVR